MILKGSILLELFVLFFFLNDVIVAWILSDYGINGTEFLTDPFKDFDLKSIYNEETNNKFEISKVDDFKGSSGTDASDLWFKEGIIPEYVIKFAPLVHLYSEEKYLPYDINKFVSHFFLQYENGTNITTEDVLPLNLAKLSKFNNYTYTSTGDRVFMTTNDDFMNDPEWLTGSKNIPHYENGKIDDAPAVLIVADKNDGWVDSYWFYFYSFNLGPFVMGKGPYGNHIGDWEHSLVRFYRGKPVAMWMSAHSGGYGYRFNAMEKYGDFENVYQGESTRPIIFSSRGTHANYASSGQHSHDIPYSILSDFTDRGPLWDPTLNYLGYTWNGSSLDPALSKPNGDKETVREKSYGPWLLFFGRWGNKKLDPSDERQVWSPWEYKYIDGPTGPLTKNLERKTLCQEQVWWKFWNGCPVRSYINMGTGIEGEGSRTCIAISSKIKSPLIRTIFSWITHDGLFCFLSDLFWI